MTTFTFDAYDGWTEERLKQRCRDLCRANMRKDMIILGMVDLGLSGLSGEGRAEVIRLQEAYSDDAPEALT